MIKQAKALAAALLLSSAGAQATTVYGDFTNTSGNSWTALFSVTNDGSLPELSNFTIYFDQSYASNLVLLASPSTWDSIVIERDLALTSDGFLDGLAITPADALSVGESASGFKVSFDWDPVKGAPASFDYRIYNSSIDPIESGGTVPSVSAIPEPSTWLMTLMGLGALGAVGAVGGKRRRAPSHSPD